MKNLRMGLRICLAAVAALGVARGATAAVTPSRTTTTAVSTATNPTINSACSTSATALSQCTFLAVDSRYTICGEKTGDAFAKSCASLQGNYWQNSSTIARFGLNNYCASRDEVVATPPHFLETLGKPTNEMIHCDEDGCELLFGNPAELKTPWATTTVCEQPYDFTSDSASQTGKSLLADVQTLQGHAAGLRVAPKGQGFVATATTTAATVSSQSSVATLHDSRVTELGQFFSKVGGQGPLPTLAARFSPSALVASSKRLTKINTLNGLRDKRVLWNNNGVKVASCDEYVYEKLYRYNRFKDLRAAAGNDDRSVFNLAYGKNPALDPSLEAKIADENLTSRKPVTIDPNSGMTTAQLAALAAGQADASWQPGNPIGDPKNLFHSVRPGEIYNIGFMKYGEPMVLVGAADDVRACHANSTSEAQLEQCLISGLMKVPGLALFDGPVLLDASLQALIQGRIDADAALGQIHDWAWHGGMSTKLASAGFHDEQLAAFDRLRSEYERLLVERAKIVEVLLANAQQENSGAPVATDVSNVIEKPWELFTRSIMDTVVHEMRSKARFGTTNAATVSQSLSAARVAAWNLESVTLSSGALLRQQTFFTGQRSTASMDRPLGPEQIEAAVGYMNEALGRQQFVVKGMTLGPAHASMAMDAFDEYVRSQRSLVLKLFFLDRAIEHLLVVARDAGCFDPHSTSKASACDWSPKVFVEALTFNYEKEKTESLSACIEATSGFAFDVIKTSKMNDITMACGKSFNELRPTNAPASAYPNLFDYFASSTYGIDKLVDLRRQRCAMAALEAFRAGRQLRKSGETGGLNREDMGSSIISLWVERDFSYGLDNIEQHYAGRILSNGVVSDSAQLAARVHGRFAAGLGILGASAEILGATADVQLSHSHRSATATVSLLGSSLLNGTTTSEAAPVSVRQAATLFEHTARFMAGPIPMSVTVGAAGEAGVEFSPVLGYDVGKLAINDAATKQVRISAGATISPYVGLDAYAQAAIDAVVASAGVEAHIAVIHASLPFSAQFDIDGSERLAGNTISMPSMKMAFRTKLTPRIRTLDGKINLFAKVGVSPFSKTYRHTIFEWHGPSYETTLFDYTFEPTSLGGSGIALGPYTAKPDEITEPPMP